MSSLDIKLPKGEKKLKKKKLKVCGDDESRTAGRWTVEEHQRFKEGTI